MVLKAFFLYGIGRFIIFLVPMYSSSVDWFLPETIKTLLLDPEIDWLLLKAVLMVMICFMPLGYIRIGLKVYKKHVTQVKIQPYESSTFLAEKIMLKVM